MPEHQVLDLSGAEGGEFELIKSDTYSCEIARAEVREIKNQDGKGKLPAGTPMWAIGFRIDEGEYENRWVWRNYIIAPAKIKGKAYEHKAKMDGMLVRFLTDIGYDPEEVTSGSFEADVQDFEGRRCRVTVGQRSWKDPDTGETNVDNEVKGTKPLQAGAESAGGGLL